MFKKASAIFVFALFLIAVAVGQPILYTVEYGDRPVQPPSLAPKFESSYRGFTDVWVVHDNWYYASRTRADSCKADAFVIPGGNTSDVPFYDGSLDSYVELLRNPGRPTIGFCAGLQFLLMAYGGICAQRSPESGNQTATIFEGDEIFAGAPNPYVDRAAHTYSIADLPDSYRNLASTRTCYVTFVRHISMPLYGSQLHIESMNNLSSAGPAILANFRNIIMQRKFHGIAEANGFPGEPGKVRISWWPAKTSEPVLYRIFCADDVAKLDFDHPRYETTDLQYEITGLDPESTLYFAVRAQSAAFVDSNQSVFPITPDGHHEIIFQNGKPINGQNYAGNEATAIRQAFPDCNYGQRGTPGKDELYWWNAGLVQFKDLEKHLAGKKIVAGKLTFLFAGGVNSQTNSSHRADIAVYRILKPWNEGIGYLNNTARTGEVTWNAAQHSLLPWEIAGCKGNSDRSTQPIASYTLKGDGTGIAFDGTVQLPAALIQNWVDHPDSNCGLLYEKTDTYPTDQYFYFEDDDDDWFMNHPRLIVQYLDESTSAVADIPGKPLPGSFTLTRNYPNPFNESTVIDFALNIDRRVKIDVYDLNGRLVTRLFEGQLAAGAHRFTWNGKDWAGRAVTSGLYFYTLQSSSERTVGRMVLIK